MRSRGSRPVSPSIRPARDRQSLRRCAVLFGAAGAAADLDLIVGAHSGPTHGIGAAIVAGLFAFALRTAWTRDRVAAGWRFGLAVAAAYSTHTLLDWLGTDTSPPIGIMALWPFTDRYYESSLHLFDAISRRYWLVPEFFVGNLEAIARELLLLLPPLALVWWWRRHVISRR
jgi:hypothetical protein